MPKVTAKKKGPGRPKKETVAAEAKGPGRKRLDEATKQAIAAEPKEISNTKLAEKYGTTAVTISKYREKTGAKSSSDEASPKRSASPKNVGGLKCPQVLRDLLVARELNDKQKVTMIAGYFGLLQAAQ